MTGCKADRSADQADPEHGYPGRIVRTVGHAAIIAQMTSG
jgi:hypothetical protein